MEKRERKKKTPGCLPIPPQICHWLLYTRLHLLDAGPEISMITSKSESVASVFYSFAFVHLAPTPCSKFIYALSMSRLISQNAWTKSSPPGLMGHLGSLRARARPFRQWRQISMSKVSITHHFYGMRARTCLCISYLAGLVCQIGITSLVLCSGNIKFE